jgi:hypothetical protein
MITGNHAEQYGGRPAQEWPAPTGSRIRLSAALADRCDARYSPNRE